MPGGPSRWSRGKEAEWDAVRPELVCEVAYDKLEAGERFRPPTRFLRWRTDKPPRKCDFAQIASAVEVDLPGIFGSKEQGARPPPGRPGEPQRRPAQPGHRR